jgi:hypothetical protein
MAAPPTTARGTPAGIKLKEGQGNSVAFSRRPTVSFWEVTFKPPGIDGGDPVEQTTQLNVAWHTMAPRVLKKLTECTGSAAYDPNVYNDILTYLINQEGGVTVHWYDGSTLDFWGYLAKFEPEELREGEQPRASFTIVPTNVDPSTSGRPEAAPVLTSVAGT